MLFDEEPRFTGLPPDGFDLFSIRDRDQRREAIVEVVNPSLQALGDDLLRYLAARTELTLHAHVPRLDWPRDYDPFCSWLALSAEPHGYQAGAQLNLGMHADHVALRLGWDTAAPRFGRFEFLARHGGLGTLLRELATTARLRFRVYAPEPWPVGSRLVLETDEDLVATFDEVRRRGVWWELGRRHELPRERELVCAPTLGTEAAELFERLLPAYEKIAGEIHT